MRCEWLQPAAPPSRGTAIHRGLLPILAAMLGGCAASLVPDLNTTALTPLATRENTRRAAPPPGPWNTADVIVEGAVGMLTPEEQDVVAHINLARSNPGAYARTFILPRRTLFHQNVYIDPLAAGRRGLRTREGAAAVDEAAQELGDTAPMMPLAVSAALTRAARKHAADQAASGATGHEGPDGSTPSSRVGNEGNWEWIVGEVAAYGPVSGREIVSRLLIDDGVASRGHRRNMLDPRFGVVGVSIQSHPRYGRAVIVDFADAVSEVQP